MEAMINELLDAGISVSFLGRDFVQGRVQCTAIWWHGPTLQSVYDKAKELGFLNKSNPTADRRASQEEKESK